MNTEQISGWSDYELLATGDHRRIERFGKAIVERFEPGIIWPLSKTTFPSPQAVFREGEWMKKELPNPWVFSWREMKLLLKPTPFRHVGVFPEQAANWQWIFDQVKNAVSKGKKIKVLNLFAYTGAATIAAALARAEVCHVDASKSTVFWASENARLSGISEKSIRWIVDDARKFVAREIKRGNRYDFIIMDPPIFGRGRQGEVWRLGENLQELLQEVNKLFSQEPVGFLLNFYATELYPEAIFRLVSSQITRLPLELYSLNLEESGSKKVLQTGFMVRS